MHLFSYRRRPTSVWQRTDSLLVPDPDPDSLPPCVLPRIGALGFGVGYRRVPLTRLKSRPAHTLYRLLDESINRKVVGQALRPFDNVQTPHRWTVNFDR